MELGGEREDRINLDHGQAQGDGSKSHGRHSDLDRGTSALGGISAGGATGAGGRRGTVGGGGGGVGGGALAIGLVVSRNNAWSSGVLDPLEITAHVVGQHGEGLVEGLEGDILDGTTGLRLASAGSREGHANLVRGEDCFAVRDDGGVGATGSGGNGIHAGVHCHGTAPAICKLGGVNGADSLGRDGSNEGEGGGSELHFDVLVGVGG
ncbi:MAG: hypothetical protein BYD32DRAFT_409531 [Podila humilis]|nr:MAG: hypothetical protein BYD32DRAFT_409531 [Podila humilis]